jgi:glyoxylase I family protein
MAGVFITAAVVPTGVRHPAYNHGRACFEARRGGQAMAVETTRERIGPVTGTHVVRVQHEGIATADAERSKDFYCRVLGFQVLPRPAFASGGYWLGTPGIFPQIHIIQSAVVPPGPTAPISPLARHTCFEVADYDAMKATLEREGIKYVENTQPGGRIQLLCNDPDGNTLEFQPATI